MKYIYVYLDPLKGGQYQYQDLKFDYEPFYIGQGKLDKRMYEHIRQTKRGMHSHKCNRIRNIIAAGQTPIIYKLHSNLTPADADALEIEIIAKIGRRNIKTGPLTNTTPGGNSNHYQKESTKQKIGWASKRENSTPERLAKLSISAKNVTKSEKWKIAMAKRVTKHSHKLSLNPNAKSYILIEPSGDTHTLHGELIPFIKQKGYKVYSFFVSLKTGRPISRGPAKGWQLIQA